MADMSMTTSTRCPLCNFAAGNDGTCPDCGQDLSPLTYLTERPSALYNRGLELAAAGDDDGAARHLEAALAENPALTDAWVVLGKIRARAGDVDTARRVLAEAVRRDPSHRGAAAASAALDARAARERAVLRSRRLLRRALLALLVAGLAIAAVVVSALASRSPVALPSPPAAFLAMSGHDGIVELTGIVPDETTRSQVAAAARSASEVRSVADSLVVDTATATPQPLGAGAVSKLAAAVATGPSEINLFISGSHLVASGAIADEQAHRSLVGAIETAATGLHIDDRLTISSGNADAERLNAAVAAIQAVGPIRFGAGKVTLDPAGKATVSAIAGLLTGVKGVRIEVDGYAARAPGLPNTAQAVSNQRAKSVADALAAAGVDPSLISAHGQGDTMPRIGRRATVDVRSE